ncbi:MAG: hypothetical protein AAB688_01900 [Patescibacteria group bacterium]
MCKYIACSVLFTTFTKGERKMKNNVLIKPRCINGNVGLATLAPRYSNLFFDWLNDPRIFGGMGDFDAYPFGIQDAEKYVLAHLKDTWLIVSKNKQVWTPLVILVYLLDKGIVLAF